MDRKLPQLLVISVTKPRSPWNELVDDYSTRLAKCTSFKHIVVKEKGQGEQDTRKKTSDEIRKLIPSSANVIVLDERGTHVSSPFFAKQLAKSTQPICFIVGSSYGVDDELREQAGMLLSLSKMVLPHELARVMLLEQLYRAHAILNNYPYHHAG